MRDVINCFEIALGIPEVEPQTAAVLVLAKSINEVASALRALGNADASTSMGAIEGLGLVLKEGFSELAANMPNGED